MVGNLRGRSLCEGLIHSPIRTDLKEFLILKNWNDYVELNFLCLLPWAVIQFLRFSFFVSKMGNPRRVVLRLVDTEYMMAIFIF